jgi:hypothetical protein
LRKVHTVGHGGDEAEEDARQESLEAHVGRGRRSGPRGRRERSADDAGDRQPLIETETAGGRCLRLTTVGLLDEAPQAGEQKVTPATIETGAPESQR